MDGRLSTRSLVGLVNREGAKDAKERGEFIFSSFLCVLRAFAVQSPMCRANQARWRARRSTRWWGWPLRERAWLSFG